MNNDLEKSKRLMRTGTIFSVSAHVILAFGIITIFTLPILGLAIAFSAVFIYFFLLAAAELFRQLANNAAGVQATMSQEFVRKRNRDRIIRYIFIGFLVGVMVVFYVTTQV